MIGDDIVITIVGIDGNKVKLGVQAPPTVSVDRAEVRIAKNSEARRRAKSK